MVEKASKLLQKVLSVVIAYYYMQVVNHGAASGFWSGMDCSEETSLRDVIE